MSHRVSLLLLRLYLLLYPREFRERFGADLALAVSDVPDEIVPITIESRLGDGTTFTLLFPIPPQRGAGFRT